MLMLARGWIASPHPPKDADSTQRVLAEQPASRLSLRAPMTGVRLLIAPRGNRDCLEKSHKNPLHLVRSGREQLERAERAERTGSVSAFSKGFAVCATQSFDKGPGRGSCTKIIREKRDLEGLRGCGVLHPFLPCERRQKTAHFFQRAVYKKPVDTTSQTLSSLFCSNA